jgi:hypothetical protein
MYVRVQYWRCVRLWATEGQMAVSFNVEGWQNFSTQLLRQILKPKKYPTLRSVLPATHRRAAVLPLLTWQQITVWQLKVGGILRSLMETSYFVTAWDCCEGKTQQEHIKQHNIHRQHLPLLFLFLSYIQHITETNIHRQHLPLLFLFLSYIQHITETNIHKQHLLLLFLFLSHIRHLPLTTRHMTICATHPTRRIAHAIHDPFSWLFRTVTKFAELACPTPEEVLVSCVYWNVWI